MHAGTAWSEGWQEWWYELYYIRSSVFTDVVPSCVMQVVSLAVTSCTRHTACDLDLSSLPLAN